MTALLLACHPLTHHAVPGELRGRIVTNGSPAAGASVRIVNSGLSVTCNGSGEFVLAPPASASYALVATFQSDYAALPSVHFDTSAGEDLGDVSLTPAGSLTGQVRASGSPVAGAAVIVVDTEGEPIPEAPVVLTDATGAYTLPFVRAGQIALHVVFTSGSRVLSATSAAVSVTHAMQTSFDFDLASPVPASPGSVTGQVVSAGNLSTVSLLLSSAGQTDITLSGASAAQFTLPSVQPGIYALGVTADGWSPATVPFVVVDGPVNVGTIVFSQTHADATADCASTNTPSCTPGAPGCDPDSSGARPSGEEVNPACLCAPGVFLQADGTCVDECAQPSAKCDVNATCIGGTGTYYCSCNSGYVGDGRACNVLPPEINELNVAPQLIGDSPGGVVTATFEANEFIPTERVSVTVGTWPFSCTEAGSAPWMYTCTYSMSGSEIAANTNAVETVTATISDAHGNSNSATGFVDFDFRQPQLTSLTVTYPSGAAAAKPGDAVNISLTTDRTLSTATPPAITANVDGMVLPFVLDAATLTAHGASFSATVPAGTASGSYQLQIVLTDSIGNVTTIDPTDGTVQVAN